MKRTLLAVIMLCLGAGAATAVLPRAAKPVRTVILIRHGEYEHDVKTADEGGLVPLGRQQARLVAARLKSYPIEISSIQASTMARARETGELIGVHFPLLELHLFDDIRECTPTTRRQDIMDELEPGEAAGCDAVLAVAWTRIFQPASGNDDEIDLVVCHGNVIRWFVTRVLAVDQAAWLGMSIANCSLTVVQIKSDGAMKLVAFADSGHIPWGMTTYPGTTVRQ